MDDLEVKVWAESQQAAVHLKKCIFYSVYCQAISVEQIILTKTLTSQVEINNFLL